MNTDTNNEKSNISLQKKREKTAIVFIIVVLTVGIISGALLGIIGYLENRSDKEKDPTNRYSNELHSYIFYKPNYGLDVTTVKEYMELDRLLYYKDGAEEYGLDGDFEKFGDAVVFFKEYFDTIIAGDWEKHNEMFTEHYYESNEPRNQFAPQMIYDMHITKLWQKNDGGAERYAFNVSYRIYRNDGTFRNDIDSGAAKTLYFELVEEGGEIKIDRITYYV